MDAQEAGGDPDPREGLEHLAGAEDRWPDLLEDGLSFRGGASCTVSSAPRPPRPLRASAELSHPPGSVGMAVGERWPARRCLRVLLASLPLTWDLHVLPLWEFGLCAQVWVSL